ncbi:hypothetical protein Pyn_18019 [Prunus yedoensis var. nudiflora]|uniref:Uncharacterized protein n=1 Tax=Prunus yedoensis var. nudiflora TaxID=2094558 RepID=A0A314YKW2_PRUYE|nr:hypothetical protein Pyn_18019 [Prunus yedoensis var. nudiflora]
MSRQYTLNINLLSVAFQANAKEADKLANQLQSTGISSGGDGAASSELVQNRPRRRLGARRENTAASSP